MEISQEQFDRLLEQIRELTARVYRLEDAARLSSNSTPSEVVADRQSLPPADVRVAIAPAPLRVPEPSMPREVPRKPAYAAKESPADLESQIGSHWFNRIGIAAVLVGVSFFLEYAFENNWIGPAGRVIIGLIAGIAVVIWSEYFRRRSYEIFSYSLKAVGIGVLYLSLWASFQVYHLLPSSVVFVFMVVVTGIMCAMALAQESELLAGFAIAGGFATPVLLSTGENRELALFSYLAVLDLAILALALAKPWRRVCVLGFVSTLLLYISWYNEFYTQAQLSPTFDFASVFFAIYAASPFLILRLAPGTGIPLALALANGVTYFLQVYVMLRDVNRDEMAWLSLGLAAVYLLLVRIRVKRAEVEGEDRLRLIHLALAVGLITVAIPIRLEANSITIGWLVEAAALLWAGSRLRSEVLNWFAILALALGIFRLVFWDTFGTEQLIFNTRMANYAIAIAVLGFAAYECSRRDDENWRTIAAIALVVLNVLALRALSLEVADYYARQITPASDMWRPEGLLRRRAISIARDFTYSALWMAYGAMLMTIGFWRRSAFVRWQALVLIAVTTVKVFVYDTSQLDRIYRIMSFIVLGVLLLGISFAYQRKWLKLPSDKALA
ncbi:MAG TPA: DUF2339 domain-containing protein [Terriglobales bacterium]|nr:DUF2339 domain-containing protein [Terriglobales bacterium]